MVIFWIIYYLIHKYPSKEFLCKKLYDPEDRVRSAVIGVVKALVVQQKDTATLANISKSLLEEIAARTKDKRVWFYFIFQGIMI